MFLFCSSASSGEGGGRGAPEHDPKTAGNRWVIIQYKASPLHNYWLLVGYLSNDGQGNAALPVLPDP